MKIELIRHGKTKGTERGCFNGRTDDPLTQQGRQELCCADFQPEQVFVTPLLRTAQTAEILFPGVPQCVVPQLREMDFGVFEGKSETDLQGDPVYQEWMASGCELPCPGGEQKKQFSARCRAAFAPLVDQALEQGKEHLTMVLHGGVLMALMEGFAQPMRDYFCWDTDPGTGFLLDVQPALWKQNQRAFYVGPLNYKKREKD